MKLLIFLAGVAVGSIVTNCRKTSGTLRIDHSNPEKDIYRFDIDDLNGLSKKKRIILKVDNYADLSQK